MSLFFREFAKDPKIFKQHKDPAWKSAGPSEASFLPSLMSVTTVELNWNLEFPLGSSEQQEEPGLVREAWIPLRPLIPLIPLNSLNSLNPLIPLNP